MSLNVLFAAYGALPNGDQRDAQGTIVTGALQPLIDNKGGVVTINNNNFNDPAVGFTKHFAAIVARNGVLHSFACRPSISRQPAQDSKQARRVPDANARAYLKIIECAPETVAAAVED